MGWVSRFRHFSAEPLATPATPEEAERRLLDGNARFIREVVPDVPAASTVRSSDPAATFPLDATPKQAPFGIVLGCSDARVPLELVFEAGPNELFVVRVAGNVLGDECLGSIEYALHNFKESVPLLVVLGHTGCGAVTAAVDSYLTPSRHNSSAFSRALRSVVNHALLAVRGGAMVLEEFWGAGVAADAGYRAALVEVSVYLNAGMTALQLREEVRPEEFGTRAVYGVFDVATCRVIGPDLDPTTDDTSKLAAAPRHADELIALGRQIARSPMVARHLSEGLRRSRHSASGART